MSTEAIIFVSTLFSLAGITLVLAFAMDWDKSDKKKGNKMDKAIKSVKKSINKKMDKLVKMDVKRDKACDKAMAKKKK